jgi:WhiB family redox-sensing transcriptional regulator
VDSTWMAAGKCRDLPPAMFFPSDGVGVEMARRVCAECPVKDACLEYALGHHIEHGVWGGASERARRRLAHGRRGARSASL